jgi:hypothetical protein
MGCRSCFLGGDDSGGTTRLPRNDHEFYLHLSSAVGEFTTFA